MSFADCKPGDPCWDLGYIFNNRKEIEDVEKTSVNKPKKKTLKVFTDKDALDYLFKNTFNCE